MRIALFNLHFATLGGGERRTALLAAHLARSFEVALFSFSPIDVDVVRRHFGIDISKVRNIVLPPDEFKVGPLIAEWNPDLFINNSHGSTLRCPTRCGIYMCMFPVRGAQRLGGYQVITANSSFTREWIQRLWHRQAEVVYSAVESMAPASAKTNTILNVGRFEAPTGFNHCKNQDVLLDVFLRLRQQIDSSWELHFVGTIGAQPSDRLYADMLVQRAQGAGVHFHFGLSHEPLRELYRSASLYWHATGCNDPDGDHPVRQEHFGMTILEAMSAGAIPLAFRGGGPIETIVDNVSGFLWSTPVELLERSRELVQSPALRQAMSLQASERSRHFSQDEFLSRMDAIVARLCPP